MKQKITSRISFAFLLVFAFIACKEQAAKEEPPKTEVAKQEASSVTPYDPAMDPLKVEAAFAKLLGDTLNVKLYEVAFKPGDSANLHAHPDHIVYVLEGATTELKDKEGKKRVVEFKTGMGMVLGPDIHAAKNIGTTTLRLLVADLYRPRN